MTAPSRAHLCSRHEKHDVSMKHIRSRSDESRFIQGNLIVAYMEHSYKCEGSNITIFTVESLSLNFTYVTIKYC